MRFACALDSISPTEVRETEVRRQLRRPVLLRRALIVGACGEDVAGRLHTARSRNDIDMTMYRMRQRELILGCADASSTACRSIARLTRLAMTVFAAHTHTQPAQPTTIAHYLHAVVEQFERDADRLRAAYASTNRSPLGACAITGTGFAIDRS